MQLCITVIVVNRSFMNVTHFCRVHTGSQGVTGGHGGSRGVTGVAGEKETKPELNGEVKKTKTIPVNPFH